MPHELVSRLKKEVGLPVDLHCHCTNGIAPMSYYAAVEAGVDILDTAMSPFSFGTSQPATETIVGALLGTQYDTGLDLKLLAEIAEYFWKVKEKYGGTIDPILERIDVNVLVYQIPGGMLSNLVSQLKQQNAHGQVRRRAQGSRPWSGASWATRRWSRRPARSWAPRPCSTWCWASGTRSSPRKSRTT